MEASRNQAYLVMTIESCSGHRIPTSRPNVLLAQLIATVMQFFLPYVNNATSVCLSLHMVCAVYICRRQGINYDIPSYFYLSSFHTPPSTLLLPHTVESYTIHKPPTTFFDSALCPDVFVSWLTSRPVQLHTSSTTCAHCKVRKGKVFLLQA